MFRWLQRLSAQSAGLANMVREFGRMLDDGRHVFDAATSAYLTGADPVIVRKDLVEVDRGINQLERKIRREIIVHSTVHGATEFPACLVLMSITKDAERIGDYAKNILDLALCRPKKPGSPYYDELLKLKSSISRMLSDTRDLYESQDSGGAPAFIDVAEVLKDECDDAITEILTSTEIRHLEPGDPAATALCDPYYKRVISHARNIVTSIVVPVDRLDYYDEAKDTRDGPPPV